jgi:hypothetical protein
MKGGVSEKKQRHLPFTGYSGMGLFRPVPPKFVSTGLSTEDPSPRKDLNLSPALLSLKGQCLHIPTDLGLTCSMVSPEDPKHLPTKCCGKRTLGIVDCLLCAPYQSRVWIWMPGRQSIDNWHS